MLKDLRLIGRDRSALLFLLLVPMLIILVVAETQSGEGTQGILFPIVNEDQGPVANALIKVFKEHLNVTEVDRPTAERLVAVETKAPAMLVLPGGMSKRYLTEKPSKIELLTDPAQWTELQAIKVIFLLADREAASLGDPFEENLLEIEERSLTGQRLKFTSLEQNVPGFSVMFVLLNLILSVAYGLRDEEDWGTNRRLAISPVPHWQILGGKLLARIIVGVIQLLILLLFGRLTYGLNLGSNPITLLLVVCAIVFSMCCFSVIVAAIARTREQIVPIGLSAVFILAALGGCWWPFYEQPQWMQTIANGAMTTWSMFAIHDVMLRDRTFLEVLPKIALLFAYGLASFAIGLRFFRFDEA